MNYQELNFRDMNIEEIYNTIQILKTKTKKINLKEFDYLYKEAEILNNNIISNFAYLKNDEQNKNKIDDKNLIIVIKLNNITLIRLKKYSDIFIKLYQKTKDKKYKEYYNEVASFIKEYVENREKKSFRENIIFISNFSEMILKYDNIVALEINGKDYY
jgi:hypothetical protein